MAGDYTLSTTDQPSSLGYHDNNVTSHDSNTMGYIVENDVILHALHTTVQQCAGIETREGVSLKGLDSIKEQVQKTVCNCDVIYNHIDTHSQSVVGVIIIRWLNSRY